MRREAGPENVQSLLEPADCDVGGCPTTLLRGPVGAQLILSFGEAFLQHIVVFLQAREPVVQIPDLLLELVLVLSKIFFLSA